MVRIVTPDEVPDYAWPMLHIAVETSGFPIVLREQDGIGYDSQLALATPDTQYHEVTYVPHYRQHRLHFLLGAALKIRRFAAVPESERVQATSERAARLPDALEDELQSKLGMPRSLVQSMSQFLYHGLVRQLTSMPMDIRVEQELYRAVPEHSAAQARYLERQLMDLEPHFDPGLAMVTPDHVYKAASSMNIALANTASKLSSTEPGPRFQASPHRDLGDRLTVLLNEETTPGYPGDCAIVDAWAHALDLRDWYEWRRPDELRP